MIKIFKGFRKEITVSVKNESQDNDPVDLDLSSEIKACLTEEQNDFLGKLSSGEIEILGDGCAGKFKIIIADTASTGFDVGRDIMKGQVEFGATGTPIPYEFDVEICDVPCP